MITELEVTLAFAGVVAGCMAVAVGLLWLVERLS
jgi:hypothetical protein